MKKVAGWKTSPVMINWIEKIWKRRAGGLLCRLSLLVLDSCHGCLMENVKYSKNDMDFIPVDFISILQPVTYQSISHSKKVYKIFMVSGDA